MKKRLPNVAVGQVWRDWDVRQRQAVDFRFFRVDKISGGFAHCTVLGPEKLEGKTIRIAIARMKPTHSGYLLLDEANTSSTGAA